MKRLVISLIALLCFARCDGQSTNGAKINPAQVRALKEAITDEIYDYGYEGSFFPEGGPVGQAVTESETRVPLYVNPAIKNGEGEVIYKLMPYGEVFRIFHLHANGLVVLDGDPEIGFPATQPDRKTVYMDDSTLASMRADWARVSFEIFLNPQSRVLQKAIERQKLRNNGFSAWETRHSAKPN